MHCGPRASPLCFQHTCDSHLFHSKTINLPIPKIWLLKIWPWKSKVREQRTSQISWGLGTCTDGAEGSLSGTSSSIPIAARSQFKKTDETYSSGSYFHCQFPRRNTARMCLHMRRLRRKSGHVHVGTGKGPARLSMYWPASPCTVNFPSLWLITSDSMIDIDALRGSLMALMKLAGRPCRNTSRSSLPLRHRPEQATFCSR